MSDAAERTGIMASAHMELSAARLDPDVETVTYRVAQEAVTNTLKSAAPSSVWLALTDSGPSIHLVVSDDGCGFDPKTVGDGLGLMGMRERAALVGGRLIIDSVPGRGTAVRLEIPKCHEERKTGFQTPEKREEGSSDAQDG
jgi:signal transduction histidine kinase